MARNCLALSAALLLMAGMPLTPAHGADRRQAVGDLSQVPGKVLDTLKARFPKAEVRKWTREEEDGIVIYDFELTQEGRKLEADIREDGTIHNWEHEIALREVPAAVRKSVDLKYPGWTPREILVVNAVIDGKDEVEEYEIVLMTADKRELEVTVAPDGRILEESPVEK